MTNRDAGGSGGLRRQAIGAALENLGRLAERSPMQLVGLFLAPGETTLLAEYLQCQAMATANGETAGP